MGTPLDVGQPIPRFQAVSHEGAVWTDGDFAGSPFVLYFYPRDETPGCTAEARAYSDGWDEFRALGVNVVGVSRDDVQSHQRFVEKHCLPFVLLCDPKGEMVQAFGATMLGGLPRRVSYLVDAAGRVAAVFDSHLRPAAHAEKMLAAARALQHS